MKLGCIFKFLAIIIVILGTSFYLYNKYGKDFIAESSEMAKEMAIQKIEKLVDDFSTDEIKNPLKEKFTDLLKDVEKRKGEYSDKKFEEIIDKFNEVVKENNFENKTLEDLRKMIENGK